VEGDWAESGQARKGSYHLFLLILPPLLGLAPIHTASHRGYGQRCRLRYTSISRFHLRLAWSEPQPERHGSRQVTTSASRLGVKRAYMPIWPSKPLRAYTLAPLPTTWPRHFNPCFLNLTTPHPVPLYPSSHYITARA